MSDGLELLFMIHGFDKMSKLRLPKLPYSNSVLTQPLMIQARYSIYLSWPDWHATPVRAGFSTALAQYTSVAFARQAC